MTCYAAFAKDTATRMSGSSGGIFPSISKRFIKKNGIVYASVYDNEHNVVCARISSLDDLEKSFSSKYMQSRLNDCFEKIKNDLKEGNEVLFCGTPCQAAGVRAYLETAKCNTDKLLLVDFICHGVPSEDVFQKYMERYEQKCIRMTMRSKENGWYNGNYSWDMYFLDGTRQLTNQNDVSFMKGFLANLYLRPSCYACKFKGISQADITLGDFWGVRAVLSDADIEKGVSCIIARTDKGADCVAEISDETELIEVSYNDIARGNSAIYSSVKRPYFRKKFFKKYKKTSDFDKLVESLSRPTIVKRVINKAYSYLPKSDSANCLKDKNERLIYTKKDQCTGCTSCVSICPKRAIYMKKDSEGFFYPVIESSKCVNCNLCDKVCIIKK